MGRQAGQDESLIPLGTCVGERDINEPFELDPAWFTRGCLIVGKPGTGKSHDVELIAKHLGETGTAVVVLDRTGEHARSLSALGCCTVYTPGANLHLSLISADRGWGADEAIEGTIDTVSHYVRTSFDDGEPLSFLQQRILGGSLEAVYRDLFAATKPVTVSRLISSVEEYKDRQDFHGLAESRESIVSRLRPLTVGAAKRVFDSEEATPFETFFGPGIHVVDLSAFRFEHPKDLVSHVLIKRLYHMAKEKGAVDHLRQLLVIDEAHHVAPDKGSYKSYLDSMAMENRKYGQGVLVATTSPSQLSRWLLKNVAVRICHLLDDGEDIDLMLRFMVNEYEKANFYSLFMELAIGEAMVRVSTPRQVPSTKVRISE